MNKMYTAPAQTRDSRRIRNKSSFEQTSPWSQAHSCHCIHNMPWPLQKLLQHTTTVPRYEGGIQRLARPSELEPEQLPAEQTW